jgi:hypothetical protein
MYFTLKDVFALKKYRVIVAKARVLLIFIIRHSHVKDAKNIFIIVPSAKRFIIHHIVFVAFAMIASVHGMR